MPQPIAVGSVLGGRYRVTQHVVTSADQDRVFLGTDQVLNRRVTMLVASVENALQVAASARELATGERQEDIQVLDLGLSEGRTYLVAGGTPDPDVLLGLAYPQQLHVEPFQTDTLGSEIFGQSRQEEAHRYDDDEAYYTDLDRQLRADEESTRRRPGLLNRLSERVSSRVRTADGTAAKAALGASTLAAADAATRAQEEERLRAEREAAEQAEQERIEAERRLVEERRLAEERRKAEEARAEADRLERERLAAEERERAERQRLERERAERERVERERVERERVERERVERERAERERAEEARRAEAAAASAPAPAEAAGGSAQGGASALLDEHGQIVSRRRLRPAPRRALSEDGERPFAPLSTPAAPRPADGAATAAAAATTPALAPRADRPRTAEASPATQAPAGSAHGASVPDTAPRSRGGVRAWLLPLLFLAGLLAAIAAGFLLLNGNLAAVPKGGSAATPSSTAAGPSAAPASAGSPRIVEVTRDVPDMPALESENDATLSALVDGSASTGWRSYSYARPNFGGYVESMNLVGRLAEPATVKQIVLDHAPGRGGSFIAYLADSPDGAGAREVGQGTFDGRQNVITVPGDAPQASYVIISLTSLPKLESTTVTANERPYGVRLTELSVR